MRPSTLATRVGGWVQGIGPHMWLVCVPSCRLHSLALSHQLAVQLALLPHASAAGGPLLDSRGRLIGEWAAFGLVGPLHHLIERDGFTAALYCIPVGGWGLRIQGRRRRPLPLAGEGGGRLQDLNRASRLPPNGRLLLAAQRPQEDLILVSPWTHGRRRMAARAAPSSYSTSCHCSCTPRRNQHGYS